MPDDQLHPVNVGKFLEMNGYTLQGVDDSAGPIYADKDGVAKPINDYLPKVYDSLRQMGMPYQNDEVKPVFNDSSTALNTSPVSLFDRFKRGLGNDEGTAEYLKTKFDDAYIDPVKGLTVKNHGVWQQVDPSLFSDSDPWKLTKDFVKAGFKSLPPVLAYNTYMNNDPKKSLIQKLGEAMPVKELDELGAAIKEGAGDIADIGGGLIKGAPAGIGGAIGLATGGPGGAIAGAGAGGMLGGAATKVLGKMAGTYNYKTPQGEVLDTLWDGALNAGFEGIALGARPLIKHFRDGLSSFAESAAPGVKDFMASLWGGIQKTDPDAYRTILDNPDAFYQKQDAIRSAVGSKSSDKVMEGAVADQSSTVKQVAEQAPSRFYKLVSNTYKALTKAAADKGNQLSVGLESDILPAINDQISNVGSYKLVKREDGSDFLKFFPVSGEQWAQQTKQLGAEGTYSDPVMEAAGPHLERLGRILNKYRDLGTLEGDEAANAMARLRKDLNPVFDANTHPDIQDAVSSLFSKVKQGWLNGVGSKMEEAGLSEPWGQTAAVYSKYGDAADALSSARNIPDRVTTLARNYFSGKTPEKKALLNAGFELMGDEGQALKESLHNAYAVEQTAPMFKGNLWKGFAALSTAGAYYHPLIGVPATAAVLPNMSPSMTTGMIIPAIRQVGGFLQGLDEVSLKAILQNPEAFNAIMRPIFTGDQMKQQIQNNIMQKVQQTVDGGQQQ